VVFMTDKPTPQDVDAFLDSTLVGEGLDCIGQ
jgi:hypothetical protein